MQFFSRTFYKIKVDDLTKIRILPFRHEALTAQTLMLKCERSCIFGRILRIASALLILEDSAVSE